MSSDRVKGERLKHFLAERDGLVPAGIFERVEKPLVRCAECDSLIPYEETTLGHIRPRSEGGGSRRDNLRLECYSCNHEDAEHRVEIRAHLRYGIAEPSPRVFRKLLWRENRVRRLKSGRLYDGVRVLDVEGMTVSFTSLPRARFMLGCGAARVEESDQDGGPKVIRLLREKRRPIGRTDEPHENVCVACDARRYLVTGNLWPKWHPDWRWTKRSQRTAPLCRGCVLGWQRRKEELFHEFGSRVPAPESEGELKDRKRLMKRAYFRLRYGHPNAEEIEAGLKAGGEEFALVLRIEDPAERDKGFYRILKELDERIVTPWGVWRLAVRREIVASGFDYGGLFWDWVRARREEFAPYLRTNGRFALRLKGYLERVEGELRALRAASPDGRVHW